MAVSGLLPRAQAQAPAGLLSFGSWGSGSPWARVSPSTAPRCSGGGALPGHAPRPPQARGGRGAALAQARGGHVGRRGGAPGPVPRRPRQQRRRRFAAPRRAAAGEGHGSGGRRGTGGRRGGPGRRRSGPSRRGGGGSSGVGAAAAAEGAAVGGAAGAVRGAGAGAALLRPLPALLDVRRHPRPRRAATGRAERLLRLQSRLRRHRRDADGRAAGAGAALPARRRQVAAGPAARGASGLAGTAALLGRPPPPPALLPRTRGRAGEEEKEEEVISMQSAACALLLARRGPVPNKAVAKCGLWSRFMGGRAAGFTAVAAAPRGTAFSQLQLSAGEFQLLGAFATGKGKAGV